MLQSHDIILSFVCVEHVYDVSVIPDEIVTCRYVSSLLTLLQNEEYEMPEDFFILLFI